MFPRSAPYYDRIHAGKDYAGEAARLRQLLDAAAAGLVCTLLDVACGTGSHLVHLLPQLTVAGLDVDPAMLALARRKLPGVPLYEGDIVTAALGRQFDAAVCLFGSIAYLRTEDRLRQAIAAMARHVTPRGVVAIEPWLTPEAAVAGRLGAILVDEPDLKIARLRVASLEHGLHVLHFHYLVATPAGIEHFEERHELGLFSDATIRAAFAAAGLTVTYDAAGVSGHGLWLGRPTPTSAPAGGPPATDCRAMM